MPNRAEHSLLAPLLELLADLLPTVCRRLVALGDLLPFEVDRLRIIGSGSVGEEVGQCIRLVEPEDFR